MPPAVIQQLQIGPKRLSSICAVALTKYLSVHNVLPLLEICQQVEFIDEFLNAQARAFLVSTFEVVSLAHCPGRQ